VDQFIELQVLYKLQTNITKLQQENKFAIDSGCKMNSKVSDVHAAESLRSRSRPLPKRGHIKSRIAAKALHSVVSVLSKASSGRIHPSRKPL
jgi:hypothetical protein